MVAGKFGDGSWTRARALLERDGEKAIDLDFSAASFPHGKPDKRTVDIVFMSVASMGGSVLASGYDACPEDCKLAIVEGLAEIASNGRKAVLSTKEPLDERLLGNAHIFVAMSNELSSALAKRREADLGGLPASNSPKA